MLKTYEHDATQDPWPSASSRGETDTAADLWALVWDHAEILMTKAHAGAEIELEKLTNQYVRYLN